MAAETILVVEDNDIQREGMAVILRQHGYSVVLMEDAEKALVYLRTNLRPHLILLDMMFPARVCDGWTFLDVRKQYPPLASIPVLITTAVGTACDEWAISLGAVGCLQKP